MASVNWMKMTTQKAGGIKVHFEKKYRESDIHSNKDINVSKSNLNTTIGCNDYSEAFEKMKSRTAEVDSIMPPKRDMGTKRITSCMLEIPCPLSIQQQGLDQQYFETIYDIMQKYFGEKNVHGGFIHRDEQHEYIDKDGNKQTSLYHMHVLVSAYTDEKGINGKAFETKPRIKQLNDIINQRLYSSYGVKFNTGGIAHNKKVEELKAESDSYAKIAECKKNTSKARHEELVALNKSAEAQNELAYYQNQAEIMQNQVDELTTHVIELTDKIKSLDKDKKELTQNNITLQKNNSNLHSENQYLLKDNDVLNKKNKELIETIDLKDSQLATLENELATLKDKEYYQLFVNALSNLTKANELIQSRQYETAKLYTNTAEQLLNTANKLYQIEQESEEEYER